jgi:transcriptional regulator with XRE-family HTH domain
MSRRDETERARRLLDPLREKLVEWRALRRMSQREVAKRMGTAQSHVSTLEAGETAAGVDVLARWADALGLEVTAQVRAGRVRWEVRDINKDHIILVEYSHRDDDDNRETNEE